MESKGLLKILFRGISYALFPVGFFFGILSLVGVIPANANDKEYYGIAGFLTALFSVGASVLLYTLFTYVLVSYGLWLESIIKRIMVKIKKGNNL